MLAVVAPTDAQLAYIASLCEDRGLEPPAVVASKHGRRDGVARRATARGGVVNSELLEGPDVYVTRYSGPAAAHPDRRRWQVTIPREYVQVDIDQLPALIDQLEAATAILKAERDA